MSYTVYTHFVLFSGINYCITAAIDHLTIKKPGYTVYPSLILFYLLLCLHCFLSACFPYLSTSSRKLFSTS